MKLTTDLTIINKAIASIARRGANLDRDIGLCALNIVAHGRETGDVSALGRLISAMPRGSRADRLIGWVQTIAPITCDVKNPKASIDKARVKAGEFDADRSNWSPEQYADNPSAWTEFKRAPSDQEFDLKALVAYLTKVAEGKRKNSTEEVMDAATRCLHALESIEAPVEA